MRRLVAVPVVQSRSGDAQPQKHSHDVHDGVGQLALMLRRSEQVREELNASVDQITDVNTGRDDLRVGRLLLVQVPCSANAQEVTAIAESVENQHDDVQHLKRSTLVIAQHDAHILRKILYQRQPHPKCRKLRKVATLSSFSDEVGSQIGG